MNFLTKTLASSMLVGALMTATGSLAADKYDFDASHSQIIFSYDHLGFSTTYGMFSGFEGTAMLDTDDITNSSVELELNVDDLLFTGWDRRDGHFKSGDFFNVGEFPVATFKSTSIEATGDNTANITGDLTIAGTTKSVVLATKLNKMGEHPRAKKPWAGFDATTTLIRSEFGLGNFAPFVGDEVNIIISVEMGKADG